MAAFTRKFQRHFPCGEGFRKLLYSNTKIEKRFGEGGGGGGGRTAVQDHFDSKKIF